jgi:hypothetical protein
MNIAEADLKVVLCKNPCLPLAIGTNKEFIHEFFVTIYCSRSNSSNSQVQTNLQDTVAQSRFLKAHVEGESGKIDIPMLGPGTEGHLV